MRAPLTISVILLLASSGGLAGAGERLAQVKAQQELGQPPTCAQGLEQMLRAAGYRVVDSSYPQERLAVRVSTLCSCNPNPVDRNECTVTAQVDGAHRPAETLRASGRSLGSFHAAKDEACRLLVDKVAASLAARPDGPTSPAEARSTPDADADAGEADEGRLVQLRVHWTGRPTPMPLLTLTRFFQRTGYEPTGVRSGPSEYLCQLQLTDPPERLAYLLESYLKNHYPSRCVVEGASRCTCRLGQEEDRVAVRLIQLADDLERLAAMQTASLAPDSLPGWSLGLGRAGEAPDDRTQRALAAILDGGYSPRIKALALLWLAEGRSAADVARVESQLGDARPAGMLPTLHLGQRMMLRYPVSWEAVTLGAVALRALGRALSMRFSSVGAYRAWREREGDLNRSFARWEAELSRGGGAEERVAKLARLQKEQPALFARLLLTRKASDHDLYGWPEADLIRWLKETVGARGLLDLLEGRTRWPELADPERRAYFSRWVLQRWRSLLGPDAGPALLRLWRSNRFDKARWVRRDLALAAAQANPDQSERLLLSALEEEPTQWMGPVLAELARRHLARQEAVIAAWFWRRPSMTTADNRRAIIAALAERGPAGRAALARLIGVASFETDDGEVVEALIAAARQLGADEFRCEGPLQARRMKNMDQARAEELADRARQARQACLAKLRAWFADQPR